MTSLERWGYFFLPKSKCIVKEARIRWADVAVAQDANRGVGTSLESLAETLDLGPQELAMLLFPILRLIKVEIQFRTDRCPHSSSVVAAVARGRSG